MRLPLPKGLERRLAPFKERGDRFLREWEWTWTSAVVASLVIAFITLVLLVFIPSWFLYYADQNLRWRTFWLLKLRDALAAGWITTWFVIILVAGYFIQQYRNKLRGTGREHQTGGYR
jgi:uncharacterized membrane protein